MTALTASLAAIGGLGTTELIIILVIVLIFFGGAKLPGLAKGFGQSVKEFKKATKEDDEPVAEAKKPEVTKTHGSN
jgi:sec-independent protein translocase protein TatA